MRIAFIGAGNMGEAMLSAILDRGLAAAESLTVSDISQSRRQYLKREYGISVMNDVQLASSQNEIVVLAVKPQNLAEVIAELGGRLKPAQLVLSILAGTRIDTLRAGFKHERIVRVMPNTPAQIGEGISVWTATASVTEQQKRWTGSILGAMGKEIYVDDEKYIDMATAVSGSGPAYFFLFAESLVAAARHIGLADNVAYELVLQTMLGSGRFLQKSGKSPVELRRMVTSPGGTTVEALDVFQKGKFAELVKQAVTAAYNKAESLGG
ncbi:pyrroline-5-carboxylate reductase [Chloroflexota bacterium]